MLKSIIVLLSFHGRRGKQECRQVREDLAKTVLTSANPCSIRDTALCRAWKTGKANRMPTLLALAVKDMTHENS
jgi:hypothetical protein